MDIPWFVYSADGHLCLQLYELTNCEHSCIGFYVNISFFLDKYI